MNEIIDLKIHVAHSSLFMSFRERYRDLIDAADTVTDMKTCAGQVSNVVIKNIVLVLAK